jgi:hypothetical protein
MIEPESEVVEDPVNPRTSPWEFSDVDITILPPEPALTAMSFSPDWEKLLPEDILTSPPDCPDPDATTIDPPTSGLEPALMEMLPADTSEFPLETDIDPEVAPDIPDATNKSPLDPNALEPLLRCNEPPFPYCDVPAIRDIEPPRDELSAIPPTMLTGPPPPPPFDIPAAISIVPPVE